MRLEIAIEGKAYVSVSGQKHAALGAVAFALEPGRVGAIVGPSGCGKTTLLRAIAGLDRRFEGRVARPGPGRLAMVFQEPRLLPWRDIEANIRLVAPEIAEPEIAALLAALGLSGHRAHWPRELSLGLARRVAIARALATRPDLLLLDEPFASLDGATVSSLVEQLAGLVETRAMTTLLVSHDIDAAIRLADVVFVLTARPGRLAAEIEVARPRAASTAESRAEIAARIAAAG